MTPGVRKLALTAHVIASVGWLGAVACFLALAVAGVWSADPQRVRAAYLAMALAGWWVIVPACGVALVTGVVQGLGTPWGLVRYYWVVVKLVLTVVATIVLLAHMGAIDEVAHAAARAALAPGELHALRLQLVGDASAALVVLVVATTLSIYKPRGVTARGRRLAAA